MPDQKKTTDPKAVAARAIRNTYEDLDKIRRRLARLAGAGTLDTDSFTGVVSHIEDIKRLLQGGNANVG